MRKSLLASMLLGLLFASSAHAQLVGTDTAPGSSCAGFPQGATRMVADADQDGENVVLICDGSTWEPASSASLPTCNVDEFIVMTSSGWDCYVGGPPGGSDSTPNAFNFTDVTDVNTSTVIMSNIVLISGIDTVASLLIGGDGSPQYRTCQDSNCTTVILNWTSGSGTIQYGRYLQLRLTSAPTYENTSRSATIQVGTVSDTWTVTTKTCNNSAVSYTTPTTTSFTIPAGCTSLRVQVWGAGANAFSTSGGGGGAYSESTLSLTPGTNHLVHVGAPGAGDSYFGSTTTVMAKGGSGTGGGQASSGYGTIKYNGGASASGSSGGGGAGTLEAGGSGTAATGGAGGVVGGGSGGSRGTCFSTMCMWPGTNGTAPGGGGAGAVTTCSCPATNGAPGQIILTPAP